MASLSRYLFPGFITVCAVVCGFFWLREEVTSRIYRDKLATMAGEYAELADQYNHAIRQSAVTELEVTTDSVAVLIRTLDGEIQRVKTPFNPKKEIFVDYLVGNGRLWIRRLFDQSTPPEEALVVDPVWEMVDWDSSDLSYGKAVYRSLNPGIWSIQVNGSGALSLEPAEESKQHLLQPAPAIRKYEEMQLSLDEEVQSIGIQDLWNFCLGTFQK